MARKVISARLPIGVATRYSIKIKEKRWHPDSNWGMEALQASALPLGYATVERKPYTQKKATASSTFH